MMLQKELEARKLPKIGFPADEAGRQARRAEIKEILCREMYGVTPDFPLIDESVILKKDENSLGGKGIAYEVEVRVRSPFNLATFHANLVLPKAVERPPMFVCYSFTPAIADGHAEEIIDNGYAIANVYYEAVVPDKEDNHLLGVGTFCKRNPFDSWGKIAIWAWAGSRFLDYVLKMDVVDASRIAVVGHSRLGKVALFAGAMDERYSMVISNDSGAGGIALYRGKNGEKIVNLAGKGARMWFCGNIQNWVEKEDELPFDAHYLAALVAPRRLYVASATGDAWADPTSEFLSCVAAGEAWESYGLPGLITPDRYPEPNEAFQEGYIGYHLRKGTHYMGRDDWHWFMDYRKKHNV